MEAKIYKEVFLGNYSKKYTKTYRDCLHLIKDSMSRNETVYADDYSEGDINTVDYLLRVQDKLDLFVANSVAFNLKDIKHIVSPTKANTEEPIKEISVPYNNVWLEDHTRARDEEAADTTFFAMYLKNPLDVKLGDAEDIVVCVNGVKTKYEGVSFGGNSFCFFLHNNKVKGSNGQRAFFTPTCFTNNPTIKAHFKDILNDCALDVFCYENFCNFLSIKNVHVKSEQYNSLTPRQKRINRLHGGLKYHTLVVSKPGKQYEHDGAIVGDRENTMPLHLCRGHVKHYTEQKPLFGKYAGTFYIPCHVRGKIENGTIAKDYALKGA